MEGQDLISAIISGDLESAKPFFHDRKALKATDRLGFSPLELARFLDKKEIVQVMDPNRREKKFSVEGKQLTVEEFEKKFNIEWKRYLYFLDYAVFEEVATTAAAVFRQEVEFRENFLRFEWEIGSGYVAPVEVRWVSEEVGWGLFASRSFKKGEFLAEYTGVVLPVTLTRLPFSAYTLQWSVFGLLARSFVIDAEKFGNEGRFMNHSSRPNVKLIGAYDRGIVHPVLVVCDDVCEGQELLFDYGEDYWKDRKL